MKKKTILFWSAAFFVVLGLALASDKKEGRKKPRYSEMVDLNATMVKSYDDFKFTVTWYGKLPAITIIQEQADVVHKTVNAKPLADIRPSTYDSEKDKTETLLTAMESFEPSHVVFAGVFRFDDSKDDGRLGRFDSLDANGKVHNSEWRDLENGFPVQDVFYNSGKPILLTFKYRYRINKPFKPLYNGTPFIGTLEQTEKKLGPIDFQDVGSTRDYCVKILRHLLGKYGDDVDAGK